MCSAGDAGHVKNFHTHHHKAQIKFERTVFFEHDTSDKRSYTHSTEQQGGWGTPARTSGSSVCPNTTPFKWGRNRTCVSSHTDQRRTHVDARCLVPTNRSTGLRQQSQSVDVQSICLPARTPGWFGKVFSRLRTEGRWTPSKKRSSGGRSRSTQPHVHVRPSNKFFQVPPSPCDKQTNSFQVPRSPCDKQTNSFKFTRLLVTSKAIQNERRQRASHAPRQAPPRWPRRMRKLLHVAHHRSQTDRSTTVASFVRVGHATAVALALHSQLVGDFFGQLRKPTVGSTRWIKVLGGRHSAMPSSSAIDGADRGSSRMPIDSLRWPPVGFHRGTTAWHVRLTRF